MDDVEAGELLRAAGLELSDDQLQELLAQTEGWPAGLYLATLAIRSGSRLSSTDIAFRGNDRVMPAMTPWS